jgi:hypothetical protein
MFVILLTAFPVNANQLFLKKSLMTAAMRWMCAAVNSKKLAG